ncbi:type I restriction modification DNA specificity domain protein [Lachnoanaerobaculum sp. ICM7]|uniref:restriction endonuclease subunit S n=1 Tax=Lachnoanaerobaculum sp. ICM7 TaxID=936594 RepID=UPI00027A69B5|nr:restriction endonuclease subunit S [Lachnoanaerobaculum sp. ICM7]EJP23563.1 type I restriction modification DNA specificity domain protein [Lachnoanaerobaculum sp. ICM7]
MTPEQLRSSILQYAIQGRLVEQRAEEGTGEELYNKIQSEKQRLIKEGKIKKEKILPEISEDEVPFDIPESWKWCYIGDIFLHNTGKAQNSSGHTNGVKRKFITTSNLYWGRFEFTKVKEMYFTDKEAERCSVKKGDLLVCEGGDYGRSAVWTYDEEVCIQNHVHRLRPYCEIDVYFFYYIFYFYKNNGRIIGKGVGIKGLSSEAIHKIIVPLPPLAEQKRIVNKIEELIPYVDRYALSYEKLEKLNAGFPDDMKKSILQYAIQGKLVEQRADEGTGEELYKKIQDEKQRLIKEGKLKKEKILPEISEDEVPFDIPESWKWVRLGDAVYNHGQKKPNKKFSYIDIGSIDNKSQKINEVENIVEAENAPSRARKIVKDGDIIYATVRPYLHNMCIVDSSKFTCEPIASTGFAVMSCYDGIYNKFIFYYLLSPFFDSFANDTNNSKGVAYPSINDDKLFRGLLMLPPLAEQKRIVSKIEELLPYVDRLTRK